MPGRVSRAARRSRPCSVGALHRAQLVEPGVRRANGRVRPARLDGTIPQDVRVRRRQQIRWVATASRKIADLSTAIEIERKVGVGLQPRVEPGRKAVPIHDLGHADRAGGCIVRRQRELVQPREHGLGGRQERRHRADEQQRLATRSVERQDRVLKVRHPREIVEVRILAVSRVFPALEARAAMKQHDAVVKTGETGIAPLRQLRERHGGVGRGGRGERGIAGGCANRCGGDSCDQHNEAEARSPEEVDHRGSPGPDREVRSGLSSWRRPMR